MMQLRNKLVWLLLLLSANLLQAQENDSTILTPEAYLEMVKAYHPMAQQARLILNNAEAEQLKAAGYFDPKLFNNTKQKYFEETTYYTLQNSGVHIPAWFGLSAKAGYEQNDGYYLSGQNTTPAAGLWYADISLTLGKGLFIDDRRAALKQAKLMLASADYEVELAMNNLYMDAMEAYWEWYRTYRVNQVYTDAVELAQIRFEAVRTNALLEEEPFIDTLEAYIQYQSRILSLQKSQVDYIHAAKKLETYLWLDGVVPLELDSTTTPTPIANNEMVQLPADWLESHPTLQYYDLKIEQLGITQRLNKEQLKPQIDISYKFLNKPIQGEPFMDDYSINNYQWSLNASFPIFLRKERGTIRKTEVKIFDTKYEQQNKQRDLENKIQALQAEYNLTAKQLVEMRKMVNNYNSLLEAEIMKFNNGESSLFLINQREIKFLESNEKLLDLEAKLQKVAAKLLTTAGEGFL